jgi:hypothetical protein
VGGPGATVLSETYLLVGLLEGEPMSGGDIPVGSFGDDSFPKA